ncbi:MAG TPA: ATP-binding protein, partial [Nakamurella sp.]
ARDGARMRVQISVPTALPMLPAAVEVAAYRIVTEAVTNAARHGGAHRADVRLGVVADCRFSVEVVDDGRRGSDPWIPGVGLVSMRERAAELGGSCSAGPGPGGGGRVRALLPLWPAGSGSGAP